MRKNQDKLEEVLAYSIMHGYSHILFLEGKIKEWSKGDHDSISNHIPSSCAQMQVDINNQYMLVLNLVLSWLQKKT